MPPIKQINQQDIPALPRHTRRQPVGPRQWRPILLPSLPSPAALFPWSNRCSTWSSTSSCDRIVIDSDSASASSTQLAEFDNYHYADRLTRPPSRQRTSLRSRPSAYAHREPAMRSRATMWPHSTRSTNSTHLLSCFFSTQVVISGHGIDADLSALAFRILASRVRESSIFQACRSQAIDNWCIEKTRSRRSLTGIEALIGPFLRLVNVRQHMLYE